MFYTIPNGSKVAMVRLVEHLRQQGFSLFDAQLMNPHLARFGAITVSQSLYLQKLEQAIQQPCRFAIRGSAV
jgi:leucyl/phenylalanyl-tRNA--protein transferase